MNYKDYLGILRIILGSIIVIFIFQNGVADALECNNCHAGTGAIKASDTLAMDKGTCLKCHNPNYPPEPMGYNTHLTHVGKYSTKVDYVTRHPESGIALNCYDCHRVVIDCRECHVENIPHVKGIKGEKVGRGEECNECHGKIDNLFRHPDISIKIHDIFDDKTDACKMCHNPAGMGSLQLANNEVVSINESYKLCKQCHSPFYNKWDNGAHWANKTFPRLGLEYKSGAQDYLDYWENKWRIDNRCATCHNPHRPNELYWIPSDNDIEKMTKMSSESPTYIIWIIGIIITTVLCVIILIKKNKIRLGQLSIHKLKLPKIPSKISLPISISVENFDDQKIEKDKAIVIEKDKDLEKERKEEILPKKIEISKRIEKTEELQSKTDKKTDKKGTFLHRGDVLFVLGIVIILLSFYILFGKFIPIVAVPSESMSPNIETGDWVIYKDIGRIDEIETNKDRNYENFNTYGDVIIYKPFGKDAITPYIHRVMYYVQEGEEMWPGGPRAPHAGYITKGDNNPQYDQQTMISDQEPVKKEWIIGVAKYRIPYIGYINMLLSRN